MSRARLVPAVAAVLLGALVNGCGDDMKVSATGDPPATPPPSTRPTAVPAAPGEVTPGYAATVIDAGSGAELCLGGVDESLPPQCDGPPLVGWDWADHVGDFEEVSGVRWGDFAVTGTFDGTSFTPSEVVPEAEFEEPDRSGVLDDNYATPCPEPDGGWKPVDAESTTFDTFQAAQVTAEQLPGYADSWVDQSINPAWSADGHVSNAQAGRLNDPKLLIFNVRVTHDPQSAERALREVYGGALCVSTAQHTHEELQQVLADAHTVAGALMTAPTNDHVELVVIYEDGSYQRWADATYGEGVVEVSSALQDVDEAGS